jgi:hypothetical protein
MTTSLAAAIDPNVKVIFLWLPRVYFSVSQINILKAFAAEGGRIVFVGEHAGFYGTGTSTPSGIEVENAFFLSMGAQMTNAGGAFDGGNVLEPAASIRPHQVMTGVTSLTVAAASQVIPGPNDFPFLYDLTNTRVLAAAAKVDVTPINQLRIPTGPTLNRVLLPAPVGSMMLDPTDPAGRLIPRKP